MGLALPSPSCAQLEWFHFGSHEEFCWWRSMSITFETVQTKGALLCLFNKHNVKITSSTIRIFEWPNKEHPNFHHFFLEHRRVVYHYIIEETRVRAMSTSHTPTHACPWNYGRNTKEKGWPGIKLTTQTSLGLPKRISLEPRLTSGNESPSQQGANLSPYQATHPQRHQTYMFRRFHKVQAPRITKELNPLRTRIPDQKVPHSLCPPIIKTLIYGWQWMVLEDETHR